MNRDGRGSGSGAPVVSVIVALLALGVAATILMAAQLTRIEDRNNARIENIRDRVQELIDDLSEDVQDAEMQIRRELGAVRIDLVGNGNELQSIDTRLAVLEALLKSAPGDRVSPAVQRSEQPSADEAPVEPP